MNTIKIPSIVLLLYSYRKASISCSQFFNVQSSKCVKRFTCFYLLRSKLSSMQYFKFNAFVTNLTANADLSKQYLIKKRRFLY